VRTSTDATIQKCRRSPSTHATAAHGKSHAAYWSEKIEEHASSAPMAATDAAPNAALLRVTATTQIATTNPASTTSRATDAAGETEPTRGAPASIRIGPPVAIHTTVPTELSTSHPFA